MSVPRPRPEPPTLQLSLQLGTRIAAWPVSAPRLRRWVTMALEHDAQLALRLVGRAEAIDLNSRFRGRDYAPNVLTFAYGAQSAAPARASPRSCVADIVLCLPVVREQARAQHKPLDHHLAHLVIHGVLHAQGYDHEDTRSAARMEAIETRLLARLRIADPYVALEPTRSRAPD